MTRTIGSTSPSVCTQGSPHTKARRGGRNHGAFSKTARDKSVRALWEYIRTNATTNTAILFAAEKIEVLGLDASEETRGEPGHGMLDGNSPMWASDHRAVMLTLV